MLAAVAVCATGQWYVRHAIWTWTADLALVGGAVVAAFLLGRPDAVERLPLPTPRSPHRVRTVVGLLFSLAGAAVFIDGVYLLYTKWLLHFDVGAPAVIGGVALWSLGLAIWDPVWAPRRAAVPWRRYEVVLFLAILAIGFWIRFYRYDYYPPPDGVYAVEEPQSGQAASLILHNGARPWEFVGDRWLPVPFFAAFGASLTTLRIPFTLVSGLTLVPFYLMMRLLVARPAALFAAALFAVSRWHLLFARSAHAVFPTTLVVVIVLYLCVRAHRYGGLSAYPWIGFLCGYTLYAYAGYRATPLLVAIFLGFSGLLHFWQWRVAAHGEPQTRARRTLMGQAVGLLIVLVTFAGPAIILTTRLAGENAGHFFEAANRSLINQGYYTSDLHVFIPRMLERIQGTARLFNHAGDSAATFNLPGEPMLDPVTGTLFLIALAYCVLWPRYRWQGFFAFCFLFLLLGGAVFVGNFDPRRLQGIIPFIFVTIGFAADQLLSLWTGRFGARSGVVLAAVALGLWGFASWHTYDVYFRRMIQNPQVRQAFHVRFTAAAAYLHRLPPGSYLVFVSDVPYFFLPSDYAWIRGDRVPGRWTADLLPLLEGQLPGSGGDVYVLIQEPYEHAEIGRLIKARYPEAQCADATHPDAPLFKMTACRVPRSAAGGGFHGGIRARYYRGTDATPFLERVEPAISYALTPDACHFPAVLGKPPCRVEWDGILEVPHTGSYQLNAEARQGTVSVTIDAAPPPLAPQQLAAGPHAIHVEASFRPVTDHDADSGARLRWRVPGRQEWDLVPFATFDGGGRTASSGQ
jgi:hypothetical protein